jgi:NitT/TauT family transport system substrate-binding protein
MPSPSLAALPAVRRGRFPRRRARAAATAAATLAAALVACGGPATATPVDDVVAFPVTFINVIQLESLTYTPELIAQVAGLFEREHLRVGFEFNKGSAEAIQNVLGGSGLLTRVGDNEVMAAVAARGAAVTVVAQPSQSSTLRMVSLVADPVRTPADMKGRTIGIPSAGGASETLVNTLAANANLAGPDLTKRVVGLGPGLLDLVRDGTVDAYVDSLDNTVATKRDSPDAVVLDPGDSTASGTQVYIASQRAVADPARRDAIVRYLRAVHDAMQMVVQDNSLDRTLQMLGSRYDIPILHDPELAKQTLRDYIASWQANGTLLEIDPDRWQRIYTESVRVGIVPGGQDPAKWVTGGLVVAGPG